MLRAMEAPGHLNPDVGASPFERLPDLVVAFILSLLPCDTRLRAREVCRTWRALLASPTYWQNLFLADGLERPPVPMLAAAVLRAQGSLVSLDVSRWPTLDAAALLAAVRAGGPGLLRLSAHDAVWRYNAPGLLTAQLTALLESAPRLTELRCDVRCEAAETEALLTNAPPFEPVRLGALCVHCEPEDADGLDEAATAALLTSLAAHPTLSGLKLVAASLTAAAPLEALVAATRARSLTYLHLTGCNLTSDSLPALTQLLAGGSLRAFGIGNNWQRLLEGPAVGPFAAALAASRLQLLSLDHLELWSDMRVAAEVLAALHGHPTLATLHLWRNPVPPQAQAAAGEALRALLAVPSALRLLDVGSSNLRDGAAGLFAGVAAPGCGLHRLLAPQNFISDACARRHVLPAVERNASLRQLSFEQYDTPDLMHATALVRDRWRGP